MGGGETLPTQKTYSFNLTAVWGVSPASSDQWKVNSLHFLFHSAVLIFLQLLLPLFAHVSFLSNSRDGADCHRLDKLTSAWWGTCWYFLLSFILQRSPGKTCVPIDGLQTVELHSSTSAVDFQAFSSLSFFPSVFPLIPLGFSSFLHEYFFVEFLSCGEQRNQWIDGYCCLKSKLCSFFAGAIFVPGSSISESALSGLWRSTQCFGGWEGCCSWVSVTLCSDTLSDLVHAWLVSTTWGEEYAHINTLTDTHLPSETDRPARAVGNQCCVSLPVRGGV